MSLQKSITTYPVLVIAESSQDSPVFVVLQLSKVNVITCMDTGAAVNCISKQLWENIKMLPNVTIAQAPRVQLTSANNGNLACQEYVRIPVSIGNKTFFECFFVIEQLNQDCIIGYPTMRRRKMDLINSQECLSIISKYGLKENVPYYVKPKLNGQTVYLQEDVVLYPQTERLITVVIPKNKSTFNSRRDIRVERMDSTFLKTGAVVGRGIASLVDNHTTVAIANLGVNTVTLHQGTPVARVFDWNSEDYTILDTEATSNTEVKLPILSIDSSNPEKAKPLMGDHLDELQRNKLEKLLTEFSYLFNDSGTITTVTEHVIDTGRELPRAAMPRRVSPQQREVIREHISKMLNDGIIQESYSPWSSPVVLVPKKDGTTRFAIDYRKLNEITKKDVYAIPRIDDTIDAMGNSQWFSTLDLASGYWQVAVREQDKEKTAFVCHEGLYEFNVMPFGLTNAPATFQRMMDNVLGIFRRYRNFL